MHRHPHSLTFLLCCTALAAGLSGAGCAEDAPPESAGSATELGDELAAEEGALMAPPEDKRRRRCEDESDCRRGQTCDKKTCDAPVGVCVERPTACPDVWAPQCGCDGRTYSNACERRAAGVDLGHEGECELRCDGIAGIPCPDGMVCIHEPGTCDIADGAGVCVDKPEVCPRIWAPVCGCDGETYGNVCEATAAGVSIEHKGECKHTCVWNGDCADDAYCAFERGACSGEGQCVARPEACTQEYRPVCGCDGKTYGNACTAGVAGVSVSHAGECVAVCDGLAGIPCAKGQFCDHPAGTCDVSDQQGTCVEQTDICPRHWQPVCGCDGVTYGNDCNRIAAGVQKEHEGACEVACTSSDDCPDPSAQRCEQDGCGTAGTCVARPTACSKELAPVCGCDGETYDNACLAELHGQTVAHDGECYCGARLYACDEGEFCNWAPGGCDIADNVGQCVPIPGGCPDVWLPVCGCDGVTYGNDCERIVAGAQKEHDGACELADCGDNADCKDSEWCARASCDGVGTCQPRPLGCPDVWEPVCGCDGKTYSNKCDAAAAGVTVSHEGECRQICGGIQGVQCDDGELCDPFPGECDVADGQGECVAQSPICPAVYDPVCGCDGATYGNDCERIYAGVGKDHDGKCECAPVLCDLFCQYGYVVDAAGCETCACNPPPSCCDPLAEPECVDATCCGDGQWHCGGVIVDASDASGEAGTDRVVAPTACGDLGPGKVCERCQPVACDLYCPWGFQVGADGCEICQCNPPPVCCDPDDMPGNNGNPHCFEGATCCGDGKWHCNDAGADATCGALGKSEMCACEPVACDLYCEYGFAKDAAGCETCQCNPGPVCPPLCDMWCRYGNVIDENGCELCQCNPGPTCCETANRPQCPGDAVTCCDDGRWSCDASMGPMACVAKGEECRDECPGVMCTLACQYGFEIGPDGCEICDCKEAPASTD